MVFASWRAFLYTLPCLAAFRLQLSPNWLEYVPSWHRLQFDAPVNQDSDVVPPMEITSTGFHIQKERYSAFWKLALKVCSFTFAWNPSYKSCYSVIEDRLQQSAKSQAHTSQLGVPSIWAHEATSVACMWIQAHHFYYAIDIVIVIKIRDTISKYAYTIQHTLGAFSGYSKVPTHNLVHIKIKRMSLISPGR